MNTQLGQDIIRKEAWNKVTGVAEYTNDLLEPDAYHAKLLTSRYAHARIIAIDTSKASSMAGVKAVVTGNDFDILCGDLLRDRPILAKEKVRYFGEPIAIVVADTEQQAKAAVNCIRVEYEKLPVINTINDAIKPNTTLIHENLMSYKKMIEEVYPIENSNICSVHKIRKGDMQKGWNESEVTVEGTLTLPQSDHAAMETRAASCIIKPDGKVVIKCSSQSPFMVKELISEYFKLPQGNIVVHVPLVGGGFGGKAAVALEVLAFVAAKAVEGKCVKLNNEREEDMVSFPCHMGVQTKIKLGAKKDGKITAAEMTYYIDCGGYAETAPKMTKAIAVDCAGPYNFENIFCDCYTVYSNHPYTTSFRGFGHVSQAFCLERMMDKLAAALNIDPLQLRILNGIKENNLTPTQTKVTLSNTGDFTQCLNKLKVLIHWDEGAKINLSNNLVRAKGIGCFSKTSNTPTDAAACAFISFNMDGSINLDCGAVECGPGMRTTMAQILAEKMKMSVDRINIKMEIDTQTTPRYWKTVASMTTHMVGRAIIEAANDVTRQLLKLGSLTLHYSPDDLEIASEKVYLRSDPTIYAAFKDLVHGYRFPNGNSIIGPVIGRGSYVMNRLTPLDAETGKGNSGMAWTVGAQAVEIEYDTQQHTYRILKAATVIDAGKVLNPKTAKGILMGGMCMGLGLGTCEHFIYDDKGIVQDTSFRTYKLLRYGETPDYLIDFVETPHIEAPFGARGIAEHGIIGIPPALANALSLASGVDITELPITPEYLWKKKQVRCNDIF